MSRVFASSARPTPPWRAPEANGGYGEPASQTPWQQIHRDLTGQFDTGAVLEPAVKFQRIAQTAGLPRDSH